MSNKINEKIIEQQEENCEKCDCSENFPDKIGDCQCECHSLPDKEA
jgi:hypothetical protein